MKVSASTAAKQVGVSIPTITRAIKSGRISGEPNPKGGWLIDVSELDRFADAVKVAANDTPDSLGHETPSVTALLDLQVKMLREQLTLMEKVMADKDGVIADIRQDRDKWQEQAERAGRLLEGPKPAASVAAATNRTEPVAAEPAATTQTDRRGWWPFSRRH